MEFSGDYISVCQKRIFFFLAGKFKRKDCWKRSTDLQLLGNKNLLAEDKDYSNSNTRVYCYEDSASSNLLQWDGQPCPIPHPKTLNPQRTYDRRSVWARSWTTGWC